MHNRYLRLVEVSFHGWHRCRFTWLSNARLLHQES